MASANIIYRGCVLPDDEAAKLLAAQETLGDRVLSVQAAVAFAQAPVAAAQLAAAQVTQAVDNILATTSVKSSNGLLQAMQVPTASLTPAAAELVLEDQGVIVINGKIVPLAPGTALDEIRQLWVAVGRNLPLTKQILARASGDVAVAVHHQQLTTVTSFDNPCDPTASSSPCGPSSQTTAADVFDGVDVNPSSVVPAGTPAGSVSRFAFWIGNIGPSRTTFLKLQGLGFTPDELTAVLTGGSTSTGVTTTVISNPQLLAQLQSNQITQLTDFDLTTLLGRTVKNVLQTYTSQDVTAVVQQATNAALTTRTADGFKGIAPAAVLLAQCVDFRRSFAIPQALAGLPSDPQSAAIGAFADAATQAVQAALLQIASLTPGLNQVFAAMEAVDNLTDDSTLDVILCLLGLNGGFGISISFDSLIAAIKAFVDAVRAVVGALLLVVSAFAALICFINSILGAVAGLVNSLLSCTSISISLSIPDFLKGLVQAIVSAILAVQALIEAVAAKVISFLSFSISLSASASAKARQQQVSCITNTGIALTLSFASL